MSETLGSLGSVLTALASAPSELLVRGTLIDEQYRIERAIGHGAMGVVYLARDLRLERDVAIKVSREASTKSLARSSREALALARLSHPNVVVIFQVGELDGRAYVAMEYVAGSTARGWCTPDRSVDAIVKLYLEVGGGLAAAHAAGLVHRDFKPDNVLVGEDGRPRVADFGLARAESGGVVNEIAGTPAYMAPEQRRGEEVDARADQYSFCASVVEALKDRRIPRHVDVALKRGMSEDRTERFATLEPLLAELRRDPRRTRRAITGGAIAALATVGIVIAARGTAEPYVDPCAGGPARIAKTWSPERAVQTRAEIAKLGSADWIARASGTVGTTLDEWSARWATSYRNVCESNAWTPVLRDRGMYCLADGEHALEATLASFGTKHVDASKIEDALARLPRPESCADPRFLDAIVSPPQDPELARRVAVVEKRLADAAALADVGDIGAAAAIITDLAGKPTPDWGPLRARIHHVTGLVSWWSGDPDKAFTQLRDTYYEARLAGDRRVAAGVAGEVALVLLDLSRDSEALEWARLAEVEVAPIPDPDLQARTFGVLGVMATEHGDPTRGVLLANRAVELSRSTRNPLVSRRALLDRARAHDATGEYELALADLASVETMLPGTSPMTAQLELSRSMTLLHMGKNDDSVAAARRALAAGEATLGPDSDLANDAIGQLGTALGRLKQYPEALGLIDRSLAHNKKLFGDKSYNVASDHNNRCDLLSQMKRYDEAVADCNTAIEIWVEILGPKGTEIGLALINAGIALHSSGKLALAAATSARALEIFTGHPDQLPYGMALLIHGAATHDRAELERSIAVLDKRERPDLISWAREELAALEPKR